MTQAFLKPAGVQRARKNTDTDAWVRPDPVDWCLALWKSWMQIPDRERGTKTMEFADRRTPKRDKDGNMIEIEQAGYESDIDSDQARQDMQAGAAVDAMVLRSAVI